MTTIIRRYRRSRLAPLVITPRLVMVAATILLAALATWLVLIAWARGGPQRVHEIVVALPAPQTASAHGAPHEPRA